ncbi:MAG: hypothetical protein NT169_21385 [Chloroflexi bacterium]|nr:hypothetical protein [Chloroflexota bacterium]
MSTVKELSLGFSSIYRLIESTDEERLEEVFTNVAESLRESAPKCGLELAGIYSWLAKRLSQPCALERYPLGKFADLTGALGRSVDELAPDCCAMLANTIAAARECCEGEDSAPPQVTTVESCLKGLKSSKLPWDCIVAILLCRWLERQNRSVPTLKALWSQKIPVGRSTDKLGKYVFGAWIEKSGRDENTVVIRSFKINVTISCESGDTNPVPVYVPPGYDVTVSIRVKEAGGNLPQKMYTGESWPFEVILILSKAVSGYGAVLRSDYQMGEFILPPAPDSWEKLVVIKAVYRAGAGPEETNPICIRIGSEKASGGQG